MVSVGSSQIWSEFANVWHADLIQHLAGFEQLFAMPAEFGSISDKYGAESITLCDFVRSCAKSRHIFQILFSPWLHQIFAMFGCFCSVVPNLTICDTSRNQAKVWPDLGHFDRIWADLRQRLSGFGQK